MIEYYIAEEVRNKTQKLDFRVVHKFVFLRYYLLACFSLKIVYFSTKYLYPVVTFNTCIIFSLSPVELPFYFTDRMEKIKKNTSSACYHIHQHTHIHIPVPSPVFPYLLFLNKLYIYSLSSCALPNTSSLLVKNIVPFQNYPFSFSTSALQFTHIHTRACAHTHTRNQTKFLMPKVSTFTILGSDTKKQTKQG